MKAALTPLPALTPRTASRLGSWPRAPIVAVTMAVATATLMTLPPLRMRLSRAEMTPCLSRSTALNMELELGE